MNETDNVGGQSCGARPKRAFVLITAVAVVGFIGFLWYLSGRVVAPQAIAHMPFPAKVLDHFSTPVPGIVGWTVEANGQKSILYATKNGRYTFLGVIVAGDGTNLTQADFKAHLPDVQVGSNAPQPPPESDTPQALAAQLTILQGATLPGLSIASAHPARQLVIAVDLHCPYCHHLVSEINTLLSGKASPVAITYVPVAILGASSAEATGLLGVQPEAKRLALFNDWMESRLGQDAVTAFPTTEHAAAVLAAEHATQTATALQQAGFEAVPDIYWMDNGEVKHIKGVPDDATLKHLLGLG